MSNNVLLTLPGTSDVDYNSRPSLPDTGILDWRLKFVVILSNLYSTHVFIICCRLVVICIYTVDHKRRSFYFETTLACADEFLLIPFT